MRAILRASFGEGDTCLRVRVSACVSDCLDSRCMCFYLSEEHQQLNTSIMVKLCMRNRSSKFHRHHHISEQNYAKSYNIPKIILIYD